VAFSAWPGNSTAFQSTPGHREHRNFMDALIIGLVEVQEMVHRPTNTALKTGILRLGRVYTAQANTPPRRTLSEVDGNRRRPPSSRGSRTADYCEQCMKAL
jgi:hypothetical protein